MAADSTPPAADPTAEPQTDAAELAAEPTAEPTTRPQTDPQPAGAAGEPAHPHLRVVRGEPNAEELAVLTALVATVTAAGGQADAGPARQDERGRWNDPSWQFRRPLLPGSGGWRAAVR